MAVSDPGQIEWGGVLIDACTNLTSNAWRLRSSTMTGWDVTYVAEDLPVADGAVGGLARFEPMYPMVTDVSVNTLALVASLLDLMDPVANPAPATLSWFDLHRNQVVEGQAVPRAAMITRDEDDFHRPFALMTFQWFIGAPGDLSVT